MPFLRLVLRVAVLTLVSGGIFVAPLDPTASNAHAQQPAKVEPSKLQVNFTKGTVVINGTKLTVPFPRKALVKLLGNPDRETKLFFNTILTWDDLGIHAYQTPDKEEIGTLHVTIDREELDFSPKKLFSGTVKIEGFVVTADSTLDAIQRGIKPAKFEGPVLGDSWELNYNNAVLFLREVNAKTKRGKANFSSLQFGMKSAD